MQNPRCTTCGHEVCLDADKAIGSGEWQEVWRSTETQEWTCSQTGDEHVPEKVAGEVKMVQRRFVTEVLIETVLELPEVYPEEDALELVFEQVDDLLLEAHGESDGDLPSEGTWHYELTQGCVTEVVPT